MSKLKYFLIIAFVATLSISSTVHSLKVNKDSDRQELSPERSNEDGYTINFNDVPVIEVIKFISKTAKQNFIYNEEELQFNVTIVSEEPTDIENIFAALLQVLRINGLSVLEEDNNLLIHPHADVRGFAEIVSSETPLEGQTPPVMTRVFQVQRGNPLAIGDIIRPMISEGAFLEVSTQTRQLIITDITTNIDKIAKLLTAIDAEESPLEIEAISLAHNTPQSVIPLIEQIIIPLSENNPFVLVPQPKTNTLFIVSTPYLVEQTVHLIQDLDIAPSLTSADSIFLYQLQNRSFTTVDDALKQIVQNLQNKKSAPLDLIETVDNARYIQASNSILFLGDEATITKIKELLKTIDSYDTEKFSMQGKSTYFIYKLQHATEEQMENSLDDFVNNLKIAPEPNVALIDALESMKWVKATNSLAFNGSKTAIAQLKQILPLFDVSPKHSQSSLSQVPLSSKFFVYNPKFVSASEIYNQLAGVVSNLEDSNLSNPGLLHTLKTAKLMEASDSIMFTGDEESLSEVKTLMATMDQPIDASSGKENLFVYKIEYVNKQNLEQGLQRLAKTLPPENSLAKLIDSMKYLPESNSIAFRGAPSAIERVKEILSILDSKAQAEAEASGKSGYFLYKLKTASGAVILKDLDNMVSNLKSSNVDDPALITAIKNIEWVKSTNSLLITGEPAAIEQVKAIIAEFDIPRGAEFDKGKSTYAVYKIKYAGHIQLMASLRAVAQDLKMSGSPDKDLIHTIETMRYNKKNNSLVFTGKPAAIASAETLAAKFDTPSLDDEDERTSPEGYLIYTPKFQSGEELISILHDFEQNLINSGVEDPALYDVINNLKWMPRTSTLLISGSQEATDKVEALLEKFDIPGYGETHAPSIETIDDVSFLIYKLQYHQGTEIEAALRAVAADLAKSKNATSAQNLIEAIQSIQWIQVTNSLIGTGNTQTLAKLKDLITNIDIPLQQVFIEVLVIETDVTNALTFGLRWGSQGKYRNKFSYGTGNFPTVTGTTDPLGAFNTNLAGITATNTPTGQDIPVGTQSGFDLGVIGDIILHKGATYLALGSLVDALQVEGDSTIVLNQKIITQDNKNSTIFVGSNLPFVGSVITNQGANLSTSTNLEYRDIGVNLSITPTIGDDGIVTLDISEQISEVQTNSDGTVATNAAGVSGIATTKTTTQTSVTMPDRHFLVLSGMIRDTVTRTKSGIPCLGGLPLIGAAFSLNEKVVERNNVIIFLKPHIINSFADYKKITEEQEDIYRDQAIAEDFDAGLELVKSADDE